MTTPDPATTPLRLLPRAGAIQAIEELFELARDLGLGVNERIKPSAWVRCVLDQTYDELETAVLRLSREKPGAWINTAADLLALINEADAARDAQSWAKIEAHIKAGNLELAPILDGREMLAIMDDRAIAWDFAHAQHPLERAKVRERYLTALRRPRRDDPRIAKLVAACTGTGMPHATAVDEILNGPGMLVREAQISMNQRMIEDALRTMTLAMVPARA